MRVKSAVASVAVLLASLAAAAPAMAGTWGSSSNPVYGYEDGKKFGKMYGNFYKNPTSAMSTTWQYDMQPGGNKVRVETDFYWYRLCQTYHTSPSWCFDTSKQTDETNSASWYKHSRARNLKADSDRARAGIDICEIQAWSNDPCSATVTEGFSY